MFSQELEGSQWSATKRRGHLDAIRQEVEVLRRLRGSLNMATLEDIFEDDSSVHIVMELCQGGELVHRIGNKHYSERTVSFCISGPQYFHMAGMAEMLNKMQIRLACK